MPGGFGLSRALPEASALADALAAGNLEENLFIGNGYDLASSARSGTLISLIPYMRDAEWGLDDVYPAESIFAALAPDPADGTDWGFPADCLSACPALLQPELGAGDGFLAPRPRTPAELQAQMLPAAAEKLLDEDDTNNGGGRLVDFRFSPAPLAWYQLLAAKLPGKTACSASITTRFWKR
jgi:hypothetical protein